MVHQVHGTVQLIAPNMLNPPSTVAGPDKTGVAFARDRILLPGRRPSSIPPPAIRRRLPGHAPSDCSVTDGRAS